MGWGNDKDEVEGREERRDDGRAGAGTTDENRISCR